MMMKSLLLVTLLLGFVHATCPDAMAATTATFFESWDNLDPELLGAQFAEDGELCIVGVPGGRDCYKGAKDIGAIFSQWIAFYDGMTVDVIEQDQTSDNTMMVEFTFGTAVETCSWFSRGMTFMEFNEEGKLVLAENIYNLNKYKPSDCLAKKLGFETWPEVPTFEREEVKTTFDNYVDGWRKTDMPRVADQFADDAIFCVSYPGMMVDCTQGADIRPFFIDYASLNKAVYFAPMDVTGFGADTIIFDYGSTSHFGGGCVFATVGRVRQTYNKEGKILTHHQIVDTKKTPFPACLLGEEKVQEHMDLGSEECKGETCEECKGETCSKDEL